MLQYDKAGRPKFYLLLAHSTNQTTGKISWHGEELVDVRRGAGGVLLSQRKKPLTSRLCDHSLGDQLHPTHVLMGKQ